MLLDNFYTILSSESSDSTIWTIQVKLNPGHPVYQGHFPGHPVVPGFNDLDYPGKVESRASCLSGTFPRTSGSSGSLPVTTYQGMCRRHSPAKIASNTSVFLQVSFGYQSYRNTAHFGGTDF